MTGRELAQGAALLAGALVLECWLGISPRFKANSTLELCYNGLRGLLRAVQSKGVPPMPIQEKRVTVSTPLYDLIGALVELAVDLIDGRTHEVPEDILANIKSATAAYKEVGPDFRANPTAVLSGVALGLIEGGVRIVTAVKARNAAAPKTLGE